MPSASISIIHWDLKNDIQVGQQLLWAHCQRDLARIPFIPCALYVPIVSESLGINVNSNPLSNYTFAPVLKMSRHFLSLSLQSLK